MYTWPNKVSDAKRNKSARALELHVQLAGILFFTLLLAQAGCTVASLRQHTVTQAGTWTDIPYRQVIENLAMVANNRDVLPCYTVVDAGTTTINDTFGINGLLNILPHGAAGNGAFDPNAARSIGGNWVLTQVTGPEKLRALHLAFAYAVYNDPSLLKLHDHRVTLDVFCYPSQMCTNCDIGQDSLTATSEAMPAPQRDATKSRDGKCIVSPSQAGHNTCDCACPGTPGYYFGAKPELEMIAPGWLHTGTKKQVPKCARYVGTCRDTCVWVNEDGMEGLSSFTLIIQRIARFPTEMAYAPAGALTAVTPDKLGNPQIIKNCEGGEGAKITQIQLPIDCYGNIIIPKIRGDAIQIQDSKLKSALTGAIKSQ